MGESTHLFKKWSVINYVTLHYYCYKDVETKENYLFSVIQDLSSVRTLRLTLFRDCILPSVTWLWKTN